MSLRADKKHANDISLNEPVGIDREGNEISVEDVICDDSECFIDDLDLKWRALSLRKKIDKYLSEREKLIIKLRYGFYNGCEKTQREVGKILGISRSYVSRIEKTAITKLRKVIIKPEL
jgi:RNA polymerase sporulation-specific sigma factor